MYRFIQFFVDRFLLLFCFWVSVSVADTAFHIPEEGVADAFVLEQRYRAGCLEVIVSDTDIVACFQTGQDGRSQCKSRMRAVIASCEADKPEQFWRYDFSDKKMRNSAYPDSLCLSRMVSSIELLPCSSGIAGQNWSFNHVGFLFSAVDHEERGSYLHLLKNENGDIKPLQFRYIYSDLWQCYLNPINGKHECDATFVRNYVARLSEPEDSIMSIETIRKYFSYLWNNVTGAGSGSQSNQSTQVYDVYPPDPACTFNLLNGEVECNENTLDDVDAGLECVDGYLNDEEECEEIVVDADDGDGDGDGGEGAELMGPRVKPASIDWESKPTNLYWLSERITSDMHLSVREGERCLGLDMPDQCENGEAKGESCYAGAKVKVKHCYGDDRVWRHDLAKKRIFNKLAGYRYCLTWVNGTLSLQGCFKGGAPTQKWYFARTDKFKPLEYQRLRFFSPQTQYDYLEQLEAPELPSRQAFEIEYVLAPRASPDEACGLDPVTGKPMASCP